MAIVLVGGGARSGKSRHALALARERGGRPAFIATAHASDDEMAARILRHKLDRGADFETIEEPLEVAAVLKSAVRSFDAIVVDCLTLWLSNLIHDGRRDVEAETAKMLEAAAHDGPRVILVTNEVGSGIVPANELSRTFRDLAGRMNQSAAAAASEVFLMVFGCAVRVK